MSDISLSEIYAISLSNSEPSHYTRIPNILSDLTYDYVDEITGKSEVRKLSVYAKELYRVLKNTAGDNGVSWRSADSLAELCNMSKGMTTKAKEELTQKFHQLDGNPLIVITEKLKSMKRDDKCIGKSPSHSITIVDIWKWNRAFSSVKKYLKPPACSPHEQANGACSPHEQAPEGACSPHEPNKNTNNKNPLFKEQQPTASAESVVFLDKSEELFPSEAQNRAYQWLIDQKCEKKAAKQLVLKFSIEDISNASKYLEEQLAKKQKKGEIVTAKWAYFRDILNKRYWEKK